MEVRFAATKVNRGIYRQRSKKILLKYEGEGENSKGSLRGKGWVCSPLWGSPRSSWQCYPAVTMSVQDSAHPVFLFKLAQDAADMRFDCHFAEAQLVGDLLVA